MGMVMGTQPNGMVLVAFQDGPDEIKGKPQVVHPDQLMREDEVSPAIREKVLGIKS